MTKTFPEVISGIRTAKKGVEVREDIAQMGEYVEQFASTATTKASEAEESAERAKNAVDGIDQQKADSVAAVQQAQTRATTAITQTKDAALTDIGNAKTGALQEVASSTEAAQTAATEAKASEQATEKSKEAAATSASTATTKASEASTSAGEASNSRQAAEKAQKAAEDAAALAGTRAGTDKTLRVEDAPADAAATGAALEKKANKDIVLDPDGNAIFYSKAEVEAKIKEILAAQREEDLARIKFWASNDPTSPASFIGGTWERIEGKFIMGASDTYPVGSTGGRTEHSHEYAVTYIANYNGIVGGSSDYSVMAYDGTTGGNNKVASNAGTGIGNEYKDVGVIPNQTIYYKRSLGRTGYGTNMPPYYSVYIWRRVA